MCMSMPVGIRTILLAAELMHYPAGSSVPRKEGVVDEKIGRWVKEARTD